MKSRFFRKVEKSLTNGSTVVVKEFVTSDIEKQRYIIKNLLLNSYNETSIYLCNLLLDLLSSDSTISLFNSKNQILDSPFIKINNQTIINNKKNSCISF